MIKLDEIKEYLDKHHKFRIVFVGDSITSTEWVHPNWREMVEYVIKTNIPSWDLRFINCGFDGSTTSDILEKGEEILSYQPNMIILLTGANDGPLGVSVERHKENVEQIIKSFGNIEYFSYLTDICPDNEMSQKVFLPYIEVDRKMNFGKTQFVDLFEISKSFEAKRIFTFISEIDIPEDNIKKGDRDFWHPNQLGNAYIAKVILKEVFEVEFNPEKYIADTLAGEKNPGY